MPTIFGRAPARDANRHNNSLAGDDRIVRWRPARDAAWNIIDQLLDEGAGVLVVGAGNAHDIPLGRIATRAASVDLVDIDREVVGAAVDRQPAAVRDRINAIELDVTSGAADAIVLGALRHRRTRPTPRVLPTPIAQGSYDLVIGDLFYSQLLYPGLRRLRVDDATRRMVLATRGPALTEAVVRRLHASAASDGTVVHLHDIACWTPGHEQPLSLEAVMEDPARSAGRLIQPTGCDPEHALERLGLAVATRGWWRWPFASTTSYLVRASVVGDTSRGGPAT